MREKVDQKLGRGKNWKQNIGGSNDNPGGKRERDRGNQKKKKYSRK